MGSEKRTTRKGIAKVQERNWKPAFLPFDLSVKGTWTD